jgi:molybdopterin converting factor small subunit
MPVLKFTPNLKRYYTSLEPMDLPGLDIPGLIEAANTKYPGIKSYILDEQGKLRKHVQVFIGEDMVKDREGLSDPIKDSDEVYIMQALSGG